MCFSLMILDCYRIWESALLKQESEWEPYFKYFNNSTNTNIKFAQKISFDIKISNLLMIQISNLPVVF